MACFCKNIIKTLSRPIHTSVLLREKPTNLKGKKHSSQLWLTRQLSDPYVELAKKEKYRCRSAFKLLEINEKYKIFAPGMVVVDCGAAPGGWTQVAVKLTNADGSKKEEPVGSVISIDRSPLQPIEGAIIFGSKNFMAAETEALLLQALQGRKVDVVLSDMAPNATGIKDMDHENIIKLSYAVMKFAISVSKVQGIFLTKLWNGGRIQQLEKDLSRFYERVKVVKPPASRSDSSELFLFANGFKGLKTRTETKSSEH